MKIIKKKYWWYIRRSISETCKPLTALFLCCHATCHIIAELYQTYIWWDRQKTHTHTLHYSSIEHDSKIFSWYSTVTREHCYSTREKNASSVFSFDVFLSFFFFCQFQTGRSLYSRCWFTFIGRICSQVHSYILVRVRVIIAYSTAHRIALIL